jgi:hypothetical protein
MRISDLRSQVATKPCGEMRGAMAGAQVGEDGGEYVSIVGGPNEAVIPRRFGADRALGARRIYKTLITVKVEMTRPTRNGWRGDAGPRGGTS